MNTDVSLLRVVAGIVISAAGATAIAGLLVAFGRTTDFVAAVLFFFIMWLLLMGYVYFVAPTRK